MENRKQVKTQLKVTGEIKPLAPKENKRKIDWDLIFGVVVIIVVSVLLLIFINSIIRLGDNNAKLGCFNYYGSDLSDKEDYYALCSNKECQDHFAKLIEFDLEGAKKCLT